MTVTKRVMAPGTFEVSLTSDRLPVPFSVTDNLALSGEAFGHVVIFPTRLDPQDYSDADLLDLSVYTGVYRVQTDRTTLRGTHAGAWLGDAGGKGPVIEVLIAGNTTLVNWLAALTPTTELYAGAVTGPAGNLDWSVIHKTPREAIDYVCDFFGVEWQVTDDFVLNVGTVADLYGSTPAVIATPWWEGRDGELVAIRSTIAGDLTVEDYNTRVWLEDNAGGPAAASIVTPYKGPRGNLVRMTRYVTDSADIVAGTGPAVATAILGQHDQADRVISATTDTFCPMSDVQCGANLWCYDPDRGIYDLANEVHYSGTITWPTPLRVQGITMALRDGMGVCFRDGDANWTDLSDWVAWESGSSRLELGAIPPRLAPAMRLRGLRSS